MEDSRLNFQLMPLPDILFAPGAVAEIGERAVLWGAHALLITSGRSFERLDAKYGILDNLGRARLEIVEKVSISEEPSPDLVDGIVSALHGKQIDVVVAVGGGSVLDAAKCVAGLIPSGDSVMEYLEGVGRGKQHDGRTVPMVAVPTTAGTGSEASMNGVLVDRQQGFKKSFRHPSLVPKLAIVDPDLLSTSPRSLIAANGCDALSQLLESYLSTRSSLLTDGLAESAIAKMGEGLIPLWESEGEDADARSAVAYGSMISGITLANAGLGTVHGLAGPVGGLFPIPHGVICGTLMGEANRINIEALQQRDPTSVALRKYSIIAHRLGFCEFDTIRGEALCCVADGLQQWVERLEIPRLGHFGVGYDDVDRIVSLSDQKANPVRLTDDEFAGIVRARI